MGRRQKRYDRRLCTKPRNRHWRKNKVPPRSGPGRTQMEEQAMRAAEELTRDEAQERVEEAIESEVTHGFPPPPTEIEAEQEEEAEGEVTEEEGSDDEGEDAADRPSD